MFNLRKAETPRATQGHHHRWLSRLQRPAVEEDVSGIDPAIDDGDESTFSDSSYGE